MSITPRLSVGLPVYNGGVYLAESIASLLDQSYEDFELLISDNASTDDTADVCRSYARQDRRIRVHPPAGEHRTLPQPQLPRGPS